MYPYFLPIDTAPINGEMILLARLSKDGEVLEIDAGLWEHDPGEGYSLDDAPACSYWSGLRSEMFPTHWSPLPVLVSDPEKSQLLAENASLKSELQEARTWLESKDSIIRALKSKKEECQLPPDGWFCTRGAGHFGPCAAVKDSTAEI